MRRKSTLRAPGRAPTYSLGETLLGTAAVAAVIATVLVAVSYPVVVVSIAALALVARPLVRSLREVLRVRRREGRTRTVCLPRVGVCLEA